MKSFTFYEQVGILIPGIALLFGATFYIPELKSLFAKDGISVGGLGLFVLIAYAAGHAVASLGNALETVYWFFWRGMPSNWVLGTKARLLSLAQVQKLETQVRERLAMQLEPLATMNRNTWFPISRQIYSLVERQGKVERLETFNGNYGLNRGLCAAALALAALSVFMAPDQWRISVGILALGFIYLVRMHRFGKHYARELYNQFLTLPATVPPAQPAPATPATPQAATPTQPASAPGSSP